MVTTNFPEEFLLRLESIISKDKFTAVIESFSQPKPISFRANTLRTNSETLAEQLRQQNIFFESVAWYPDAFILKDEKAKLMQTEEYKNGLLYIQNLSSMIPALVMNPRTRDVVCDLTAAPGSKTTQLAMMMNNKGKIVANDISRSRLHRLRVNLEAQGITNTDMLAIPGQYVWRRYPNYFDKSLVDAPCTMEGRFLTLDPDSFKDWTPKKIRLLSKLQKYLLRSAITATKPGGLIVYSTCTLEPEENEDVVDWVLEKENVELEEIKLTIPELQPGLTEWKKKQFNPQITKTKRILPSETMEGFYIAALRKR